MNVRAATPDDAPSIAAIHVGAWRVAYRNLVPDEVLDGLSIPQREASWRARIDEGAATILVAEDAGEVVGWLSLGATRDEDGGDTTELYALYVDPERWRAGIGRSLWDAAAARLRERSAREVTLWVLRDNLRARGFYESVGFVLDADAEKTLEVGGDRIPEVRYRCAMTPAPALDETVVLPADSGVDETVVLEERTGDASSALEATQELDPDETIASTPSSRATDASALPAAIGAYPIVRELGRGGMGVVYVAEDTRLQRRIALKLLPQSVSRGSVAFTNLEREARLLAQMNHPNIATIHSLEETGDGLFLTMELVDGETLDARLARGALSMDELLSVTRQIATALEAAHQKLVVHRDLKPQNIMLTGDGLLKVLDFGLALALPKPVTGGEAEGVRAEVAGTPGYMSPEQIRGEATDGRTDLFALGCILYECLTGKMAFPGRTVAERLRAALHQEPDMARLPGDLAPRLRTLLERCLAKPVDERVPRVIDVRRAVEDAIAHRSLEAAARSRGVRDDAAPNNLPLRLARFVGRERELAAIAELLEENRFVTLIGVGGGGKTRLAVETGSRIAARSPGRPCRPCPQAGPPCSSCRPCPSSSSCRPFGDAP